MENSRRFLSNAMIRIFCRGWNCSIKPMFRCIRSGDWNWIGQPVADLYQVHLDWPWYLYEVVPLTGQNEINAALKTAVFFNDEMDRLKYRLIESGELAELKPLCQVHGNHVLLRGPYMKAPR